MIRLRFQQPLNFSARPDRRFNSHYQRELRRAIEDDDYRPRKLDDELAMHFQLDLLEAKSLSVDRELFVRACRQTRQRLLAPDVLEPTPAVSAGWSQSEAARLWEDWWPGGIRRRDVASYESAKAVLVATSALGTTYVHDGWDRLRTTPELLETFSGLAHGTSRASALGNGLLPVQGYTGVTRLLKPLAEEAPVLIQLMCIELARELARLFPHLPVGHWVSIDAQAVPAWAAQRSSKRRGVSDPELERYLRRRCPDAGFRVYGYDRDGVGDPDDPRRRIGTGKAWRGYLQLIVADLATGLPLVGVLGDASSLFEPEGLRALLSRLYGMWPDIPLEGIVGDKLYDIREACRTCEVEFGIAPVFIRRPSHVERQGHLFAPDQHATIQRVDGWGVAYCRQHGRPMRVETIERPDRSGLLPGEPTPENRFRMRFACTAPEPCGRASLKMSTDWSSLSRLPHHHLSGRPREFALRQALQSARNSSVESAHSSLQLGYRQGLKEGSRARVFDMSTLETMHWLGYSTRALVLLMAHRDNAVEVGERLVA